MSDTSDVDGKCRSSQVCLGPLYGDACSCRSCSTCVDVIVVVSFWSEMVLTIDILLAIHQRVIRRSLAFVHGFWSRTPIPLLKTMMGRLNRVICLRLPCLCYMENGCIVPTAVVLETVAEQTVASSLPTVTPVLTATFFQSLKHFALL